VEESYFLLLTLRKVTDVHMFVSAYHFCLRNSFFYQQVTGRAN